MPTDKPLAPDAAPTTQGAAPTVTEMEDVFFDEDCGIYASPNGMQMLRPGELPSPLSEVVANAPMNRRAGSFFAAATAREIEQVVDNAVVEEDKRAVV